MPGGTGPGGVPIGDPRAGGGLSGPERWIPSFESALRAVTGPAASARAATGGIPPISAHVSGQMRDYLGQALGLLRFGANIEAFNFHPSIGIVARDLNRLAIGISNYKVPLTRSIKMVMIPSIRTNFQVNGRPPWEPLVQDTTVVKHREPKGLGRRPILYRTGKLKSAASSFDIWDVGENSATIRNLPESVWYGNVHQAGMQGAGNKPGSWFEGYRSRARQLLRKARPSRKDVDDLAWTLFDMATEAEGSRRKGVVNIPQRRFILFQPDDISDIQRIFYEWLDEEIVRLGKFVPGV